MNEPRRGGALARSPAFRIASLAVLTAVTAVFTYMVRIPVAPTRGYLNLGDVAIYFTAFSFGPVTALISGGLGTALADMISGYSQWAPISLVVHGLQGLVAGLIGGILGKGPRRVFNPYWLVGAAAGTVLMCGGYLLSGTFMVGFGAALVELPGNLLQNLAGIAGGIPLAMAVRRAYPPIGEMRW
ncbi:MAG: ECF transporter S component [Spirochaetales bacterium]|nr:ECF transporter S component [Spirochaetales bacterium]